MSTANKRRTRSLRVRYKTASSCRIALARNLSRVFGTDMGVPFDYPVDGIMEKYLSDVDLPQVGTMAACMAEVPFYDYKIDFGDPRW